ncbi:sulfotransferase [Spiribacter halobius]|uniref:Sulfotransferase n=1 Tax=Sediminicurvatus halobius TaxID=2182432 RepID=A0A2U2N0W1_9GAMM|nr:sulfotransferase [Spiribacter halobius]
MKPLARLVDAMNEPDGAPLHAFGRFYAETLFSELLTQRERLRRLWEQQPEILDERITRPVIILGLPRSGTSFLFNLLAQDPAHRFLSNWEATVSQVPPPRQRTYLEDPRRRKGRRLMRFQHYLAPGLKDVHTFHLDGPEECTPLLMQGFTTQALAGMFEVPSYSAWLDTASHAETYRHHRRILQTLQWTYPGERWLLKSPDHLSAIDALAANYPGACFVHLHRDPLQSVASWASLNAVFRGIHSSPVDPQTLGTQVLNRLSTDINDYLEKRPEHPEDLILDLYYDDLVRKPMDTVETIYRHFDLHLSADAVSRMQSLITSAHDHRSAHRYTPEDFALSPADVDNRFAAYTQAFDIPLVR